MKAIRQQIVEARRGRRGPAAGVVSSFEFGGMADVWEEGLDRNGKVDVDDVMLFPDMKSLGFGWCITPGMYGRFYQNRDGEKVVIYPHDYDGKDGDEYNLFIDNGKDLIGAERAKWCVFSFVAQSRSLAIGQLDMYKVFKENINLSSFGLESAHYGHSFEFRSNVMDTWAMWDAIVGKAYDCNKDGSNEKEVMK